jgi:hypothetical protein
MWRSTDIPHPRLGDDVLSGSRFGGRIRSEHPYLLSK